MDKSFLTTSVDYKEVNEQERSIKHYISKKSLDRGNDIVLPEAIDDKNYSSNPIVLFNHNTDRPIGRSLWRKADDNGVLAKTKFGTTPDADDIYLLNKEKILNGWSIGFMIKDKGFDHDSDTGITTFTDIELLEYSSVSVPMNQDAVTEGLKMVKSEEVKSVLEHQQKENESRLVMESFKEELKEIKDLYNNLVSLKSDVEEFLSGNSDLLVDLEKAEKNILSLKKEMEFLRNEITKRSAGTLDSKQVFDEALKQAVGDVNRNKK